MLFYADLHIHSKYSRATSRDCDLENLSYWGRKKGITVIGTGDFTHPAWIKEIKEKLAPAEPGLYRLKPDLERRIRERLPPSCQGETRFMLSVEISTIYKKGDKTRKIHHLVYAPTIEKAEAINRRLEKIGNIRSDGRPILGLDSRHLLEIVLSAGKDCYLVPAHIWTPWFAVLGSKSGFDNVAECYGDLADHVFAVETGLSSDPEMNWKISHLDRYALMSNSDAHSPQKLGREACRFDTDLDYFAMKKALETRRGFGGTVEFFPEEGKYHMDGHRKCEVRLSPAESKAHGGLCPACHKPLTLGVLYRVEELADRKVIKKPVNAADFKSFIPLPEMLSEIEGVGAASQRVVQNHEGLLAKLGPELEILGGLPLGEIQKQSSSLLAEALRRMRSGEVIREAGYDGEYGIIKLFKEKELKTLGSAGVLFDVEKLSERKTRNSLEAPAAAKPNSGKKASAPSQKKQKFQRPGSDFKREGILAGLDQQQLEAAKTLKGPLMILAGPGSGKTRTLTHRIAHLIQERGIDPKTCLTLTFTRRACEEMERRLLELIPDQAKQIPVTTFHGLGWQILNENRNEAGLQRGFRVGSTEEFQKLLEKRLGWTLRKCEKNLREISKIKTKNVSGKLEGESVQAFKVLEEEKENSGLIDYDDLMLLSVELLAENPGLRAVYQKKFQWISVDEYQDTDELGYQLLRQLVPQNGNLCVIGDPDQSIYSFRGSDVKYFLSFEKDFPGAKKIFLLKNYRSGSLIVEASGQMISPSALIEDRRAEALLDDPGRVMIHQAPTEKAEAEFVAHSIEKMLGGVSFFSLDTSRAEGSTLSDYSFSDFAVLYRTDKQSKIIEEALHRLGLPFQKRSHRPLSENPLVISFLEVSQTEEPRKKVLPAFEKFIRAARPDQNDQMDPAVERIRELASRFNDDWEGFLSVINLGMDLDAWDERAERISLLTLHAAKGLEFRVVFIVGCEDGLIPLTWGGDIEEEAREEERRLFFVGMTRAKEYLFLSHAAQRMRHQKVCAQKPSPFLKDIEERLLERLENKRKKKSGAAQKLQMNLF